MKYLVEQGLAYPCFCTKEEKEEMTSSQEKRKDRIGYYGRYAKCRKIPVNDAYEKRQTALKFEKEKFLFTEVLKQNDN